MFPSGPIHVVAQGVDVLKAERRRGSIERSELGIPAAARAAHVHYAGGETRHDLRTGTAWQTGVSQGIGVVRATERKPRCIEHGGRKGVVFGQRNPLIPRGRQVAEKGVIPLCEILNRIVNGKASKEGVVGGEVLVDAHLPVVLPEIIMV